MNTVRSEKRFDGERIDVPADAVGRTNSALAGAFPHFDGENAHPLIHALALTRERSGKS